MLIRRFEFKIKAWTRSRLKWKFWFLFLALCYYLRGAKNGSQEQPVATSRVSNNLYWRLNTRPCSIWTCWQTIILPTGNPIDEKSFCYSFSFSFSRSANIIYTSIVPGNLKANNKEKQTMIHFCIGREENKIKFGEKFYFFLFLDQTSI